MSIQTMTETMRRIIEVHDGAMAADKAKDETLAKVLRDHRNRTLAGFRADLHLGRY